MSAANPRAASGELVADGGDALNSAAPADALKRHRKHGWKSSLAGIVVREATDFEEMEKVSETQMEFIFNRLLIFRHTGSDMH